MNREDANTLRRVIRRLVRDEVDLAQCVTDFSAAAKAARRRVKISRQRLHAELKLHVTKRIPK